MSYNKYDKIRPHSIRSMQSDQKVRPLSFRPEKFDLFTATQLEDTSVDNVVLTGRLSGIKLVVSSAYVRPDDFEGLRSKIKVIQSCKTYVDKNCLNGALFFGDLIARHTYWGDKSCNLLGEELVQTADQFSILNDGEPTFLAANGYSIIDLCICYGPLFDRCKHSLSTDEFAELFTGAPQRGHAPIIMRLERSSTMRKPRNYGLKKLIGCVGLLSLRAE